MISVLRVSARHARSHATPRIRWSGMPSVLTALARQSEAGFGLPKTATEAVIRRRPRHARKHASFLRPPRVRLCVFVRCVRSHAAGCTRGHSPFRGITAFAPVSRASASGIRLALPLAVAAIDLANLLREHLRLIECGVGRRLENGALAAAHATGGRPVRAESATEREKQLPGASVSDRRDRFIRHPQVMAQATPCIRRKT